MKKYTKILGIIALVAVIGFSIAACKEDDGGGDTYNSDGTLNEPSTLPAGSFTGAPELNGKWQTFSGYTSDDGVYHESDLDFYKEIYTFNSGNYEVGYIYRGFYIPQPRGTYTVSGNSLTFTPSKWFISTAAVIEIKQNFNITISEGWYDKAGLLEKAGNYSELKAEIEEELFIPETVTYSITTISVIFTHDLTPTDTKMLNLSSEKYIKVQ